MYAFKIVIILEVQKRKGEPLCKTGCNNFRYVALQKCNWSYKRFFAEMRFHHRILLSRHKCHTIYVYMYKYLSMCKIVLMILDFAKININLILTLLVYL